MRAEKEDMPERLRTRKKRNPWLAPVIIGLCSATSIGLMLKYAKPITIDLAKLGDAITVGRNAPSQNVTAQPNSPLPSRPAFSRTETPEEQTERMARELLSERVTRMQALRNPEHYNEEGKQIVFNDENYRPKPLINVIQKPSPPEATKQIKINTSPRKLDTRTHETELISSWDHKNTYWAEWEIVNNEIDGATVCQNLRKGSIEYRDCRKGAKQYFKHECRRWEDLYEQDKKGHRKMMLDRYCKAGRLFSPIN